MKFQPNQQLSQNFQTFPFNIENENCDNIEKYFSYTLIALRDKFLSINFRSSSRSPPRNHTKI